MDSSTLFSISFLSFIFIIIGALIAKLWWDEKNAVKRRQALLSMNVNDSGDEEVPVPNRRRQRVNRIEEEDEEHAALSTEENLDCDSTEKKIGKKKLAKLQAKAQAKAQREAEQAERLERKKLEEEQSKIEELKRKTEEEEEKKRLAKLKEESEERKRKEQEEYNKLKASFIIEEQGFDQTEDLNSENLIQAFLCYIIQTKVVFIDELASKFSLTVDDTIDRLNQFISDKLINGVFDDRGKFICITNDELMAVIKFINQRGRVTIQEIVDCSNRLVSLDVKA